MSDDGCDYPGFICHKYADLLCIEKDTLSWAGAGPPQLRSFHHILAAMRGHDWSYRITRSRRWSSETLSDVSGEEANHFMQLAISCNWQFHRPTRFCYTFSKFILLIPALGTWLTMRKGPCYGKPMIVDQRVHSAKESRLFPTVSSECFPDNGGSLPEALSLWTLKMLCI